MKGLLAWLAGLFVWLVRPAEERAERFARDTRAISDAVAIMLFIAMVVVIAAVVGANVLSKAPSGAAPVAQLSIYGTQGQIVIDHLGGDAIDPADVRIIVYDLATGNVVGSAINGPTIDVDTDNNGIFNVGDKIIIDSNDLAGLTDGQYTVRIIFVPLNKPIAENNVFVSS